MNDQELEWKTLSSEYLFSDTWFTVRKDICETFDGKIIDPYYVYEFPEWITAVAFTEDEKIILVKQYRHAINEICIELSGGCADATDKNFEAAIRRELLKEIGYTFTSAESLGDTSPNPSTNANRMHMFLQKGGRKIQGQHLDKNEQIEVLTVSFKEFIELVLQNKIIQAMPVTTIFLHYTRWESCTFLCDIKNKA